MVQGNLGFGQEVITTPHPGGKVRWSKVTTSSCQNGSLFVTHFEKLFSFHKEYNSDFCKDNVLCAIW